MIFGTMNVYLSIALVVSSIVVSSAFKLSSIQKFFEDQSENINIFFEEQKHQVTQAFNASYQEAIRITSSVGNYLEVQENKVSDVGNINGSGRKEAALIPDKDNNAALRIHQNLNLSAPSVITSNGYTCETHTVVSQGYVLNIHRIPRSKSFGDIPKNTVILQHGLFGSSADWILNGPEKGLAYVLANAGYDVWMPNIRGNKYSEEHESLKSDSKSFWNFSWHDVAVYDLPSVIDYVVKRKGKDTKITYIGHSMGNTVLFAMLTLKPEYNDILNAGFALAPVVFFTDIKSSIKNLAPTVKNVAYVEILYGTHKLTPKDTVLGKMITSCYVDDLDSSICTNVISYICDCNEKEFIKTFLHIFLSSMGTSTSWKTVVHFAQEIIAGGKFQQFDYGSKDNLKMYGVEEPPKYDLSKITLPIKLFWAENDVLASRKDVQLLYDKLPLTKQIYKVPNPKFKHLDYIRGLDAHSLINEEILKSLNASQYSTESKESSN